MRAALIHRLPLNDFDVEVTVPRDLSDDEARRVANLVRAVAVPGPELPPLTIKALARGGVEVQDACSLSGVVRSMADVVTELWRQPECTGTDWVNNHPIVRAYVDKLASLASIQGRYGEDDAYKAHGTCKALADAE